MDDEVLLVDSACRNFKGDVACVYRCETEPVRHVVEHFLGGVKDKRRLVVTVYLERGLVEKGNVASAENAWDSRMRNRSVEQMLLLQESPDCRHHIRDEPCRKEHEQQGKVQQGGFSGGKEAHEFLIAWSGK